MNRFNKYDRFFSHKAGIIVTKWNNFSGQCNITLARFVFRFSFLLTGSVSLLNAMTTKNPPTTWTWLLWIFVSICWIYIWIDSHYFFRKIEEGLEGKEESLTCNIDLRTFERVIFRARWFTGIGIFFFIFNIISLDVIALMANVALFGVGFSVYIGFFLTPKKKDHVLARAKKKLANTISAAKNKVKDLAPTPLPTPVAVRI